LKAGGGRVLGNIAINSYWWWSSFIRAFFVIRNTRRWWCIFTVAVAESEKAA
jgi:hypothetical protein